MQAHVLRGTKQQIAEDLARMPGEVREAIVFVEESVPTGARMPEGEDLFAEMRPYMVDIQDLDDTREAIYRHGKANDPPGYTRLTRSHEPQAGTARAAKSERLDAEMGAFLGGSRRRAARGMPLTIELEVQITTDCGGRPHNAVVRAAT